MSIGKQTLRMTPEAARKALYEPGTDGALRNAVWCQAISEAQREKSRRESDTWRLLAVWLGLPGLYRTIHRIERRLAADRADLEGEAVLALLEALDTTDPESADAGSRLVKTAVNQLWAYASRSRREVPVVDIAAVAAAYQARIPLETEPVTAEGWELHITPPPRDEGLAATLRFTESRVQREGERLGALAQCAGLPHLVFRARRHANAARIGTLVLRSPEAER
ncbi:hypothetical protein [Streptomyces monomycini]|uniref:hypothetical protein n=1 Tax=Streptomyces monomycini TaxID=371720 RepID=UPI0012FF55D6|nr:hypothetical protein [Streptomyces monomycini]